LIAPAPGLPGHDTEIDARLDRIDSAVHLD
jgi:hypothetical protein